MNTVAFVCFMPLTSHIYNDYCIGQLMSQGIKVKFYYFRNIYKASNEVPGQLKNECIVNIDSFNDFKKAVKNDHSEVKYILLMHLSLITFPIYRILSKNKSFMVFLAWGQFFFSKKSLTERLVKNIKDPIKILSSVLNKIALKLSKLFRIIKSFDLVFTSGSVAAKNYKDHIKTQNFNYFDYELFLQIKDQKPERTEPYAVFLDMYLPYHSDQEILGIKPIEADKYFDTINLFFNRIEKELSMKVIIAAHPKSMYKGDEFGGREIIINKSNELVRDSNLVLSHLSSSFVFAVLFKKSLVFLSSTEIDRVYPEVITEPMKNIHRQLDCHYINMDSGLLPSNMCHINEQLYDAYKYNYLCSSESENRLNHEIIIEALFQK